MQQTETSTWAVVGDNQIIDGDGTIQVTLAETETLVRIDQLDGIQEVLIALLVIQGFRLIVEIIDHVKWWNRND